MFGELARLEDLLAQTYRDRVQYELLQNSDDAGAHEIDVTITAPERHPTSSLPRPGVLTWSNDGRPMTASDVTALCRSASSTKHRGDAIGYRGIGFKSLAAVADRIHVTSAGAKFTFDRTRATAALGEPDPGAVPLIRIPCDPTPAPAGPGTGTSFHVEHAAGFDPVALAVHPTALLFLRNVRRLTVTELAATTRSEGGQAWSVTHDVRREGGTVELSRSDQPGDSSFALRRRGQATVAIPLDGAAFDLTGVRGRLACFLPLADQIGLPVVVSGDLLTDPSRTHAVIADDTTRTVLTDAAHCLADILTTPHDPLYQRTWELLTAAEDIRTSLIGGQGDAPGVLLQTLADRLRAQAPPFSLPPVALTAADARRLEPHLPVVLADPQRQQAARPLRAAFGLKQLDLTDALAGISPSDLQPQSLHAVARWVIEQAHAHGRSLTPAENDLCAAAGLRPAGAGDGPTASSDGAEATHRIDRPTGTAGATDRPAGGFPSVVARWRAAESAVVEWLNQRGWTLADVSTQNLGYDATGTDANGRRVHVEVKKVDRPDARFSMTNNELALIQSGERYLIAVVVGDGPQARVMLLEPGRHDIPRERVVRQWEWQFHDWVRFGTWEQ